jgi:hypothetical protein
LLGISGNPALKIEYGKLAGKHCAQELSMPMKIIL